MNVLILGGSGFIGSALVPALRDSGWDITLANRGNKLIAGTHQIVLDRDDDSSVSALGAPDSRVFDLVIDTSAYTGPQVTRARSSLRTKTRRWIHLSSAAVYRDDIDRAPLENDPIGGAAIWGDYGVEKSDADQVHLAAVDEISTVILRPPYLYGPCNDNDRETFVFARALTGRPIIVPGMGDAPLQFLHVFDLASTIVELASRDWNGIEIYNIAEPQIISSHDWVELLCNIVGARPRILFGGTIDPEQAPRSYFPFRDTPCVVDTTKIHTSPFAPTSRPLAQGFAETFASYDRKDLRVASPTTSGEKLMLDHLASKRSAS